MKFFLFIIVITCTACTIPDKVQTPKSEVVTSDIVLFNDFERPAVGIYTMMSFLEDWNGSPWELGIVDGRVYIVDGEEAFRGKSLQIAYPRGQAGFGKSGASWQIPLDQSYDELYCAYRIKFAPNFDFGSGGKIPGFIGGDGNTSGRRPSGSDGWSARILWQANGDIAQHIYHLDQPEVYGEIFPWQVNGLHRFRTQIWHSVENRIVMNTPGQNDGLFQAWFDGVLALQIENLRFRNVDHLGIDAFYFTTFFGDDIPSSGPSKDEIIYFDNLMIATAPITH